MSNDKVKQEPLGSAEPSKDDRYECRACGYIYQPTKGDMKNQINPGTAFAELPPTWKCPVCGAKQLAFSNIGVVGSTGGFKENYKYGLGVNTMDPEQKNLLIFGAIGLAIIFFLSLYTLN